MFFNALKQHWPEYLIEAAGLGAFMVSACSFAVLLFHPASPAVAALPDPFARRVLMGTAMGATAVAIIYSPWGRRSGAHLNPATTLTFYRLGKVRPVDALGYVAAQFAGGIAGTLLAALLLGAPVAAPEVNYVATVPGRFGVAAAFLAEALISFVLMTVVLHVSNRPRLAPWTGLCAGALVLLYISLEGPVSGMSMNPARTLGSALAAREWSALWLYFTAPPLGMLLAAELYAHRRPTLCAKLRHDDAERCIFNCEYEKQGSGVGCRVPGTRARRHRGPTCLRRRRRRLTSRLPGPRHPTPLPGELA